MTIAYFNNTFDKNFTIVSPERVIESIAAGTFSEPITRLRTYNQAEYDAEKKKLPAVTWSGTFQPGTREIRTLTTYSQLVVLDVDHLDPTTIPVLKQQLATDEHVRFCFVSPSGTGLKIVIKVNTGPEHHRAAFLHLQHEFQQKYLITVDQSGKDVSRLCYVSYDPAAIINLNSKVWEVDMKYDIVNAHKPTPEGMKATQDIMTKFHVCVKWVERNKTYRDGEKNIYLHALACALNRVGVPQETTIQLIHEHYQTPDTKWYQSVRSAYFHNQHEHGKIQVRDLGGQEFIAPPYVANFTEDVVVNDIMQYTAMLYNHKVPNQLIVGYVEKLARYYDLLGYIDMRRNDLYGIMNNAITVLQQHIATNAAQQSLQYVVADDVARDLIKIDFSKAIKTHLGRWFDEAIGGFMPGNFYEVIGFGGTYKSILLQFAAYKNAMDDIPSLYLNGEMAKIQFYERLALMTLNVNLRAAIAQGVLNEATVDSFIEQIQEHTKRNIFMFNGSGYNKTSILAALDHIEATTGKRVRVIYMDGISQMDQMGLEEAAANIRNGLICKDIAKEAYGGEGVVVISLLHCSGEANYTVRNTATRVRGGSKMIANADGYFCTSLLVDPDSITPENPHDMGFLPGKLYVRMVDKRSNAGVVNAIINITRQLHVEMEECDPRQYEFNPNNQRR